MSESVKKSILSDSQWEKLALPVLTIIALALYLPGLGSYGPLDPTDSFFIESAREMVETGQYLLPMFNYQTWLDKPVLYFWMVAASYKILGVSAFAGRLVSALSAVSTGLIILQGARHARGVKEAFVAALVFLTFPLVSIIGHESLTDMTLTLFMSGALMGFFDFYCGGGKMLPLVLAYISLALAFFCKGPVAVIIVGAIIIAYIGLTIRSKNVGEFARGMLAAILKLKPVLGLTLFVAIGLPWYVVATIKTNGAFFDTFFITQNFGRMAGKVNHLEPFWYYLPVIAGGLFPLNLVLFSRFDLFVEAFKNRLAPPVSEGAANIVEAAETAEAAGVKAEPRALVLFALVWSIIVLTLFEVIKTKLATYILPAMPPLAILTAASMFVWLKKEKVRKLAFGGLLFVVAGAAGLIIPHVSKPTWVMVMLHEQVVLLVLTVIVGLLYGALLLKNKALPAFALLLLSAAIGVGVCVPAGHRVFYNEVHRPFEAMIERAIADRAQLATVVTEEPSISYFLHRHIELLTTADEARNYLATVKMNGAQKSAHYVLVPQKCLKDMEWFPPGYVELAKIRKWSLFRLD